MHQAWFLWPIVCGDLTEERRKLRLRDLSSWQHNVSWQPRWQVTKLRPRSAAMLYSQVVYVLLGSSIGCHSIVWLASTVLTLQVGYLVAAPVTP
jgi:hypothetical protein